ncbi:MAG: hypothetical protein C4575_14170 [Desulforudis sp.]|jgi:hypothetical protein|nr:MAG: hypothetical protein C4575_14170 [Desulforudis sp.]
MNNENDPAYAFRKPITADQGEVTEAINKIYQQVNLANPRILWFESVLTAELVYYLIHKFTPEEFDGYFGYDHAKCTEHLVDLCSLSNWRGIEYPVEMAIGWFMENGFKIDRKTLLLELIRGEITPHNERWLRDSALSLLFMSQGRHCMPKPLYPDTLFGIDYFINQLNFVNQNCFCWYPLDDFVILVKRPLKIEVNRQGYLHCDDGPATLWRDGSCSWHLNGTMVPNWVVERAIEDIDSDDILMSDPLDRSEILKKIGLNRFIELFDATTIDKRDNYELIKVQIDVPDYIESEEFGLLTEQKYLKMRNPTTGEYHIEGVHPECNTLSEALTWRNSTDADPLALT